MHPTSKHQISLAQGVTRTEVASPEIPDSTQLMVLPRPANVCEGCPQDSVRRHRGAEAGVMGASPRRRAQFGRSQLTGAPPTERGVVVALAVVVLVAVVEAVLVAQDL